MTTTIMRSSPQQEVDCTICLDPMKNPIVLPCGHQFCYKCLESWRPKFDIFNKRTCPKCRRAIPPTREMITTISSIKRSFIAIESKLNSPGPLTIPDNSSYGYIRLLPESERQPEIRRALERQAQVQLDTIYQFNQRFGENPEILDISSCFDALPAQMAEAVRNNDCSAIAAFLGPPPVSKRRLHAKCPSYSDDTLLHMASSYCNLPLMKLLLSLGVDVNNPNIFQFTPLMHSLIDTKDNAATRLLLCWGARKVAQSTDELEPAPYLETIAKSEGKSEIAQLLRVPLGGRRCILHGMCVLRHFNGKVGIVTAYEPELKMYQVTMEQSGEIIWVSSKLLKRCDQTPKTSKFTKTELHALGALALLYNGNGE